MKVSACTMMLSFASVRRQATISGIMRSFLSAKSEMCRASGSLFSTIDSEVPLTRGACCDVYPVPILSDNYSYLVVDRVTNKTACVDPAEPSKVLKAASERNLEISMLLCTHKHWDHSGGNIEMSSKLPGLSVIAPAAENDIPAVTKRLKNYETLEFGSLTVTCIHTPCHTRGHSVFLVSSSKPLTYGSSVLFSGDTLFVGGCGRFFEGEAKDMLESLGEGGSLRNLPLDTLIYCGHEYTVSNLLFASSVEPGNSDIEAKLKWAKETVAAGKFTVPSTISEEIKYNPFMRAHLPQVMERVKAKGVEESMLKLREWKNNFVA